MNAATIAATLPLKATEAEIQKAAETAIDTAILTRDNIRAHFTVWNDYHNNCEGNNAGEEVMSFEELIDYVRSWRDLEVENLTCQIDSELRHREKALQELHNACTRRPIGETSDDIVYAKIPKGLAEAYATLLKVPIEDILLL